MKALHEKAKKELNPDLIDISTCNLHKIHNAFSKAYDSFGSDVEDLGIESYYYFKNSPVSMEDFEKVQVQLGIPKHVFLRHLPTRWLTLEHVNDRLIEQLPALEKFFNQKALKQGGTGRSERIRKILASTILMIEMLFLKTVMAIFGKILRLLQTEAPLIHILHDQLSQLISTLMRRFLKSEVIDGKHGVQLCDIDVDSDKNLLKKPDVGTAAKILLDSMVAEKSMTAESRQAFLMRARTFYQNVVKELLRTLPMDNRLLN